MFDIPANSSGVWKIESFIVPENDLRQQINFIQHKRSVPSGKYLRLMRNNTLVMSNTPDEINDFIPFINKASGNILINGLGLGTIIYFLLKKPDVKSITVIENSMDVINLVKPYINNSKVNIILDDAFNFKTPKNTFYDAVWHDIWDNICADNIPEMNKLLRKYYKKSKFQLCWCKKECMLLNKRNWRF